MAAPMASVDSKVTIRSVMGGGAMKARSARLVRARVPFAGKGTLVHPLEEGAFLHGRPSSFGAENPGGLREREERLASRR